VLNEAGFIVAMWYFLWKNINSLKTIKPKHRKLTSFDYKDVNV